MGAPGGAAYTVETQGLSPRLIDLFRRTKGWVQFLGILSIIAGILIGILALAFMFGMASLLGSTRGVPASAQGVFVVIGLIYLVMAAITITLGVKMVGYGSAIRALVLTNNMADAERAVDIQRSIWKIYPIL